jgi:HEAT repeat protein
MSLLSHESPEKLASEIEQLSLASLRRHAGAIEGLLNHRDPMLRLTVVRALQRARKGVVALRKHLSHERNVLVLAELADALATFRDRESLSLLQALAEEHSSPIVRSYSLLALADISGKASIPYLLELRKKDRSRRVRATLDCVLFSMGHAESYSELLKDLRSRDSRIRALVANLLYYYSSHLDGSVVQHALREAAEREPNPGVRGDLERALSELS